MSSPEEAGLQAGKALLRGKLLRQRAGLTHEQVQESSARLCAHILACDAYRRAERIMGYLAFGREISLDAVLAQALADGKEVYVPYIISAEKFIAARLHDMQNFSLDRYGIRSVRQPEGCGICPPEALELIIVPGVAFAKNGARLGMGAGYYDRFLARCGAAYKLGAGYCALLQQTLPAGKFDLAMDAVATEKGIFSCR